MNHIKLHDKYFVPFIENKRIVQAIDNIATKMNKDFENFDGTPILLCVLNGSIMFTGELMQRINFQCELTSIRISSYIGTKSAGSTKQILGINRDLTGKTVIIVEDIVDTGVTIEELHRILLSLGAAQVKVCTLLVKPDVYQGSVTLDYVAMEIPNKFIVGFGLDYDQLGRNYKDIYVLEQ